MNLEFTIGAETANARNVETQVLQDRALRHVLSTPRALTAYLSSDAAGAVPINASAADMDVSVGAAGKLLDSSVDSFLTTFSAVTDATGKVNFILTNAGDVTVTVYLNIIDPASGKVTTSPAIAFIDNTP